LGVAASTAALVDRYSRIHRDLKTLRAQLSKAAQTPGTPLNQQFGEMRRVVRRSVGQLTTEKAANTQTVSLQSPRDAGKKALMSCPR
jgi:nucleoporin GLE1